MKVSSKIKNIPFFYYAFACAYILAIVIALCNWQYAYIPLAALALACLIAPFMITIGYYVPIISRGLKPGVALTFDDGPDITLTPKILELLREHNVKAAFFVTGERAKRYPEIIRMIHEQGHIIGNHSYSHSPLLMLQSTKKLYHEINITTNQLRALGTQIRFFRPPAGITNPRLGAVLKKLNLLCVNFSCRAFDRGNRNIADLARKILTKVKPGDIILLHDRYSKDMDSDYFIDQITKIITGLRQKKFTIYPLDEFIN